MLLKQLINLTEDKEIKTTAVKEAYTESSDFDSDMSEADAALKKALKIMSSKSWLQHMKDTDTNFNTDGIIQNRAIVALLKDAYNKLDALYHDFENAA